MRTWSKIGIVSNGRVCVFKNNQGLSLESDDFSGEDSVGNLGLFSYDSYGLNSLYTTNIYTSTENGVLLTKIGDTATFRVDWINRRIQLGRSIEGDVYIEYVAEVHDPSTETLINDIAQEYIESFIYYREARFKFGAAHRETKGAEYEWLEAQDDYAANTSNLTGEGILYALDEGTRRTIAQ